MKRRTPVVSTTSASMLAAGCLRTELGRGADVGFRGTMNGTYLAFSIEELTTIEFAAIDTTSGR